MEDKVVTLKYFPEEFQVNETGTIETEGEQNASVSPYAWRAQAVGSRTLSGGLVRVNLPAKLGKPPSLVPPSNWQEVVAKNRQIIAVPKTASKSSSASSATNPFNEKREIKTKYYKRDELFHEETEEEKQQRIREIVNEKERERIRQEEEKRRKKELAGVEFL